MTSYNSFRDEHLSRVLPAGFAEGSSATDAPTTLGSSPNHQESAKKRSSSATDAPTAGAHRPAVNQINHSQLAPIFELLAQEPVQQPISLRTIAEFLSDQLLN